MLASVGSPLLHPTPHPNKKTQSLSEIIQLLVKRNKYQSLKKKKKKEKESGEERGNLRFTEKHNVTCASKWLRPIKPANELFSNFLFVKQ